jgi:hypothetical protein
MKNKARPCASRPRNRPLFKGCRKKCKEKPNPLLNLQIGLPEGFYDPGPLGVSRLPDETVPSEGR